jgi:ABC-type sugar transport system substrate-binding protein
MKKAISILIAALMIFTLFACSGQGAATSPSAPPSSAPSSAPSASASPAASASQAPSPSADADISTNANKIGFFSDGVDPASRKTYNVVWSYMRPMALFQNINNVLTEMEPKLNFKTTAYCANSDIDALIQNIQVYADQKVDGFLIVIDPTAKVRIKEVLDETKIPYIAMLNSVRDDSGSAIVPCVGLEGKEAGAKTLQWLYDNYKTYWGEIDTSKIGLLDFNFSPNVDFNDRHDGALAKFKELLPNNTNIFDADGVSGKLDEQTGYDLASTILAAHPEVEYWFVPACIELYSQGAARAVEALNMDKKVLITDVGSDVLPAEWDGGYEGSWVSCLGISDYQYTIPGICGLIALMDGKATPETLWSSKRAPTDQVTFYNITNEMVTKETYKAFFEEVKKEAGLA